MSHHYDLRIAQIDEEALRFRFWNGHAGQSPVSALDRSICSNLNSYIQYKAERRRIYQATKEE